MVEKKLFLQNQSTNIMHPNRENMFVLPILKLVEIITGIHVSFIHQTNFGSEENGRKKLFLENQSTNIMYPNEESMLEVANPKISGHYYAYPCWSHWMDEL